MVSTGPCGQCVCPHYSPAAPRPQPMNLKFPSKPHLHAFLSEATSCRGGGGGGADAKISKGMFR